MANSLRLSLLLSFGRDQSNALMTTKKNIHALMKIKKKSYMLLEDDSVDASKLKMRQYGVFFVVLLLPPTGGRR